MNSKWSLVLASLAGAACVQLGMIACGSAQSTEKTANADQDAASSGSQPGQVSVSAKVCARWEVKSANVQPTGKQFPLDADWEPFAAVPGGGWDTYYYRHCLEYKDIAQ